MRRLLGLGLTAGLVLVPAPPQAQAAGPAGLTISVPSSASLGSAATGASQVQGSLGAVTVTTGISFGTGGWVATTVSTAFTTGGGTSRETIPAANVGYTSGPVTGSSGLSVGLCTPGQLVTAVALDSPKTAMSCGGFSLLSGTSVTWRPTITIALPASAVAGSYTGTITHSVA